MGDEILFLFKVVDLVSAFHEHGKSRCLYSSYRKPAVINRGKCTGSIDADQPVCLCPADRGIRQIPVLRSVFQVHETLHDCVVFHRRDPQAFHRKPAPGQFVDTVEDKFSLPSGIAGIHHIIEGSTRITAVRSGSHPVVQEIAKDFELLGLVTLDNEFPLVGNDRKVFQRPFPVVFIICLRHGVFGQMAETPADCTVRALQIPIPFSFASQDGCNGHCDTRFLSNYQKTFFKWIFTHVLFLLFLIKKAGTAVCGCLHLYDHFLFPVLSAVSFCFCRAA